MLCRDLNCRDLAFHLSRGMCVSNVEYRRFSGQVSAETMATLAEINQEIFGFDETAELLMGLFQAQQHLVICMAFQEGRAVGFKVGFGANSRELESWRGGVLVEARRQGVAEELMRMQHQWAKENGFHVLRTTTNSDNIAMLILNLKSGFEIVGSFVNRRKRLKLLQEKWLEK